MPKPVRGSLRNKNNYENKKVLYIDVIINGTAIHT